MRALLGTLGGSGVFAVLAAGGMWTAVAVAAVVVAVVLVTYRLVHWILDSDDRTRRAKELLHGGRPGQGPPSA
jgi:hypothetical protein